MSRCKVKSTNTSACDWTELNSSWAQAGVYFGMMSDSEMCLSISERVTARHSLAGSWPAVLERSPHSVWAKMFLILFPFAFSLFCNSAVSRPALWPLERTWGAPLVVPSAWSIISVPAFSTSFLSFLSTKVGGAIVWNTAKLNWTEDNRTLFQSKVVLEAAAVNALCPSRRACVNFNALDPLGWNSKVQHKDSTGLTKHRLGRGEHSYVVCAVIVCLVLQFNEFLAYTTTPCRGPFSRSAASFRFTLNTPAVPAGNVPSARKADFSRKQEPHYCEENGEHEQYIRGAHHCVVG